MARCSVVVRRLGVSRLPEARAAWERMSACEGTRGRRVGISVETSMRFPGYVSLEVSVHVAQGS